MSAPTDWDWWRLFCRLDGLPRHHRTQTSRVFDYWNNLRHSERNAEKQHYSKEPCSTEMDWTEFFATCHLFQVSGMELSALTQAGEDFTKAYWNLDARITATLTNNIRPQGSVNVTGGNEVSSSHHSTRRSRTPISPAVAPRQDRGDDDPPPYVNLQTNHAADRPPPYDPLPQGRSHHEQRSRSGRFLDSIILAFAATQSGHPYLLPPLPVNVARDERRSSRGVPSGHGSSASPDSQTDSRQRSRSARRPVCQTSRSRSPTFQGGQARFPVW
jgi:hypothetical protein